MPTTTNMNIVTPTVSTTPGPQYATILNAAFSTVDSHDHSPGKGVPVSTAGISLNADLPFNSYNATLLRTTRYNSQSAALALGTDLNCAYVVLGDLYYNDGSGNQVRITSSGAVNVSQSGNITGMGGTTASVVYASGSSKFTFSSAASTPAYMACGPIILSTNSASQHTATITPPAGLGADYVLTLPSGLPAATKIMTCDASGNIGVAYDVDNVTLQISSSTLSIKDSGVSTAKIAAAAVTTAKIADANVTAAKIETSVNLNGKAQVDSTDIVTSIPDGGFRPNGLVMLCGEVAANGSIAIGGGFTAAHNATGGYLITFTTPFYNTPIAVATPIQTAFAGVGVIGTIVTISSTQVQFSFLYADNTGADTLFSFIVIGAKVAI